MNDHVTFTMAKALNWRYPVSFGWKKADTEDKSEYGPINLANEQYPAPSITDIMAELPNGTTIEKFSEGYFVSLHAFGGIDKTIGLIFFHDVNPANALAEFFVYVKRKRGENIEYAKDVKIEVNNIRMGDLPKSLIGGTVKG